MSPKFSLNIDLTLGVNAPLVAIFDSVNVKFGFRARFLFQFFDIKTWRIFLQQISLEKLV
jgi:hypothetical protein